MRGVGRGGRGAGLTCLSYCRHWRAKSLPDVLAPRPRGSFCLSLSFPVFPGDPEGPSPGHGGGGSQGLAPASSPQSAKGGAPDHPPSQVASAQRQQPLPRAGGWSALGVSAWEPGPTSGARAHAVKPWCCPCLESCVKHPGASEQDSQQAPHLHELLGVRQRRAQCPVGQGGGGHPHSGLGAAAGGGV